MNDLIYRETPGWNLQLHWRGISHDSPRTCTRLPQCFSERSYGTGYVHTPQDNVARPNWHVPFGPPRTRLIAAPINTPPAVCVPARGAARGVSDGFQPLLDLIVNGGAPRAVRAATLPEHAHTQASGVACAGDADTQQRIWPMPI
jgi:hypothetical protein